MAKINKYWGYVAVGAVAAAAAATAPTATYPQYLLIFAILCFSFHTFISKRTLFDIPM